MLSLQTRRLVSELFATIGAAEKSLESIRLSLARNRNFIAGQAFLRICAGNIEVSALALNLFLQSIGVRGTKEEAAVLIAWHRSTKSSLLQLPE